MSRACCARPRHPSAPLLKCATSWKLDINRPMHKLITNRLGNVLPALRSFGARAPQARMFASKSDDAPASLLSDAQVLGNLRDGKMQHYNLEADIGNATRSANLRRLYLAETIGDSGKAAGIKSLPFEGYDYQALVGANCENVIGYVPIPVGVFGPLNVDGKLYHIPMATTEGCLVASANRGARAITQCGGAVTALLKDAITRSPVLRTPSLREAESIVQWLGVPENFERIRLAFNSSSRFASLQAIKTAVAGRSLFLRFACTTGDAMGMNMVSKGTQRALAELATVFPDTKLVSISGNYCCDKKPAAINWIEGRGKSVVAEATVSSSVVKSVLKASVNGMVQANILKNHVGSAVAGSIGGFNAHAANLVAAIFLATGQDPAQVVESSQCITQMEETPQGDLLISVSMPSIEVGTVGGGMGLKPQQSMLAMLGVAGSQPGAPGDNARQLSRVIAASVLCGELSLMASLTSNTLVESHMRLNRKKEPSKKEEPPLPGTCTVA